MKGEFEIKGERDLQALLGMMDTGELYGHKVTIKPIDNSYTAKQRGALHVAFELWAEALNDAGYDMKKTLSDNPVEIPWTKELIKEVLYKTVLQAMTQKTSTEDQSSIDPSQVYLVLNRHLSEKFGIHIPFPSLRG